MYPAGDPVRHAQQPTYSFVILTFILIMVNTLLAWLSVAFLPAGTGGVATVYVAVAFMILFTLWFGAYGAIAAYAGTLFGGVLSSGSLQQHPEIAVIWAVAGLIQVIIPLAAARTFELDLTLPGRRDFAIVLLFGVLLNNLAGAAWGAYSLSLLGPVNVTGVFVTWLAGNILVTLLIVPAGLRFFTDRISRSKLFVKHYWD